MKRFMCSHLFAGFLEPYPAPSYVLGCCSRSCFCPVCGFGAEEAPHNDCQGWDPDPDMHPLVERILSQPAIFDLAERGQKDAEEGRLVSLADIKAAQGDA